MILFPLLFAGLVYVLATSGAPLWQAVMAIVAFGVCVVVTIALMRQYFNTPKVPPVQVTTDGWLVVGRRRWMIDSLAEIELSGHYLLFKNSRGRTLCEVREFQTGDLEGFVHFLKHESPDVVVRASSATMRPRQVRMPKGS